MPRPAPGPTTAGRAPPETHRPRRCTPRCAPPFPRTAPAACLTETSASLARCPRGAAAGDRTGEHRPYLLDRAHGRRICALDVGLGVEIDVREDRDRVLEMVE